MQIRIFMYQFLGIFSKSKLFIMIELKEKAPDLMCLSYVATRPPALIPNRTEFLRFWLLTSILLFKANVSTHYSLFSGSKQEYQTRKQDL